MAVRKIQNVVLIGAGNLATNLGVALHEQKFNVAQVYNRTAEKGKKLAARIGAEYTDETEAIILNADIYVLAVTDSVIGEVARNLPLKDQLVVHTAGTIDMNILADVSENIGVFYPVQTFPGKIRINFNEVPICLEANSPHVEKHLSDFANKLSNNVHFLDSSNRMFLHLSAVFASNFAHFMNVVAEDLMNYHEIPFDLLKPIIRQTGKNARRNRLFRYQTGPAVRGDNQVLQKHRELLASYPEYLELYNLISDNIIKYKALHGKL